MDENLIHKAVKLSLEFNWKEAIKINSQILKELGPDIDALNRLAKAYFELGDVKKAIQTSKEVLKIDPINNIAKNSLDKYKSGVKKNTDNQNLQKNTFLDFIEIPGKTKLVTLINLGSENVCLYLNIGDKVLLVPHAHKVSVTTTNGKYIGKLTDDVSAQIRNHIKNGKKYNAVIKYANKKCVKIFIESATLAFPKSQSESI